MESVPPRVKLAFFSAWIIWTVCAPTSGQELLGRPMPSIAAGELPPTVSRDESAPLDGADSGDILDLDLDQLTKAAVVVPSSFDVAITSVTRSESTVGKSPAAVFVITQEMIRRSGATCIPEALRMAPGLSVAKNGSNQWAITSRGLNSRFSSNLLVMIDGRAVYNPFFNGVFWEVQDYPMQDIERIEVIRGPGATIWGANAVNGVINIITKSSKDTQGTLVSIGAGSVDQAINTVRHGDQTANGWTYRTFVRHTERGPGYLATGAHDDWRLGHIGFRADKTLDSDVNEVFTLQGDLFTSSLGQNGTLPTATPPFVTQFVDEASLGGGNLLARWSRSSEDSSSFLQLYYDRFSSSGQLGLLTVNTFDAEYQNRLRISERNHLTVGINARRYLDEYSPDHPSVFRPIPLDDQFGQFGGLVQDEIEVVEDRATLYVGSKFLTNSFTGFEIQPGIRGLWAVDEERAIWASVSRAVRLPSRIERGLFNSSYNPEIGTYIAYTGNPQIQAQDLMAYEVGYRAQPREWFSWDITSFYNNYTDVMGVQFAGFQPGGPPLFVPTMLLQLGNTNDLQTYGVEYSFTAEMTENWRLRGWYTFLELFASGAGDTGTFEGNDPQNQVYLMSSWNLRRNWEFDLMGRYVDSLPSLNVNSYFSLDSRIGYRLNDRWELALVGQNLLSSHHSEFNETYTELPTQVPRGIFLQAVWRQ